MSISVYPIPSTSTDNAITATIPVANRQYFVSRTFGAGIYTISNTSATTTTITFVVGSSLVEAVTSAGSVQVNLSSDSSGAYIRTNTGTDVLVTITKTAAAISSTTLSGTLDTVTTTSTYNTTGRLYVLCVGGGGGGGNGQAGNNAANGGVGGTHASKIVVTNAAQSITIGNGGNAGASGGATTFGSLVNASGGSAGAYTNSAGQIVTATTATRNAIDVLPNINDTNGGGGFGARGGNVFSGGPGNGAGSGIGTGGNGGDANQYNNFIGAANAGTGYGAGGGGGASNQNSAGNGAAGTAGVVYILRNFS